MLLILQSHNHLTLKKKRPNNPKSSLFQSWCSVNYIFRTWGSTWQPDITTVLNKAKTQTQGDSANRHMQILFFLRYVCYVTASVTSVKLQCLLVGYLLCMLFDMPCTVCCMSCAYCKCTVCKSLGCKLCVQYSELCTQCVLDKIMPVLPVLMYDTRSNERKAHTS